MPQALLKKKKNSNKKNKANKTKQSPRAALKRAWNCLWYLQREDLRLSVPGLPPLPPFFGKRDEASR